jgi:hypothetical protein
MTESMLGAEAWCNLKKSGAPPWSPELALAAATLRYWNLRLKEVDIRDSSDDPLALEHLAAHISLPMAEHHHHYDFSALAQRKRSASARLKAVKLAADEHREKCLAQNAALFVSLHGFSSKNAAKAILALEKSSKQLRQLRSILNPAQSYGLDQIDVPDQYAILAEDESVIPRILLVLGSNIEAVLLPHTQKRFRQHAETPFGAGERSHRLGQDCTSEDAQSLLNGAYAFELDSLTPEALKWFKQFRMHQSVRDKGDISLDVSAKEWVQFWANARESTSSSPFRHPLRPLQDGISAGSVTERPPRLLTGRCRISCLDGAAPPQARPLPQEMARVY